MLRYWNKKTINTLGERRIQVDYSIQYDSFENEIDDLYDEKLIVEALRGVDLLTNIYQFYFKIVNKNVQSKVLDHKGVWGQLHEDAGLITGKKVVNEKCIYWGIKKVDSLRLSSYSPMAVFVNDSLDRKKVYSAFEVITEDAFDLCTFAKEISINCNAVVVIYTIGMNITVSVFYNHGECL